MTVWTVKFANRTAHLCSINFQILHINRLNKIFSTFFNVLILPGNLNWMNFLMFDNMTFSKFSQTFVLNLLVFLTII